MWNIHATRQANSLKYGKNKSKTLAGLVQPANDVEITGAYLK